MIKKLSVIFSKRNSGRLIACVIANQDAPKNNVSKKDQLDGLLSLLVCGVPISPSFCFGASCAPGMCSTDSPENLKAS